MTLYCGIEDPLGPNEQLYAVGPDGGRGLATFSIEGAARVTLVSAPQQPDGIQAALATGIASVGAGAYALDAWASSTPEAFRDRAARTRYQKLGATLHECVTPHGVVIVAVSAAATPSWPLVASDRFAHRALVACHGPADAIVAAVPPADAAEWAARGPSPSEGLIRALVEQNSVLVYVVRDDIGRLGACIVGARALVAHFAPAGPDVHRYVGLEAGRVLRLGPGSG